MRPTCSVFIATSLDGFIARPDGGLDFLERVNVGPGEDHGYAAFFSSIQALVVGRATWEVVRGFTPWPWQDKRVVVLTHRPLEAEHGELAHEGPLLPMLERLHEEGVRRVYVDGGQVIQQFLAEDLIDDLTISVVPVILGAGLPLFESLPREIALRTAESRSYRSGLVQTRHEVVRTS